MSKRKSRAKRLAEACHIINVEIDKLRDISSSGESDAKKIKLANEILGSIPFDEIENLRGEIEEWRSNIEEKFSSTQKYSDLEECESELGNALSEIENGNSEVTSAEEIEDRISDLDNGVGTCEGVSFPGMFR